MHDGWKNDTTHFFFKIRMYLNVCAVLLAAIALAAVIGVALYFIIKALLIGAEATHPNAYIRE